MAQKRKAAKRSRGAAKRPRPAARRTGGKKISPIPKGYHSVTPYLTANDGAKALDFYTRAFGARVTERMPGPDGKLMHAEMRIGDRPIFLCDDFPEYCDGKSRTATALGGTPVTIHRYVDDCDAAIQRAEKAGATVKMPAQDMFWGDRYGVVTDPCGHDWSLATHISDPTPEEMTQAMQAAFAQG